MYYLYLFLIYKIIYFQEYKKVENILKNVFTVKRIINILQIYIMSNNSFSTLNPQILQKSSGSGGIHIHNKELDEFFKENIIYNPENVLLNAIHEIKQGRNNYVNFTSLQKEMDSINECMKDALKANKELQKSLKGPVLEKFLSKQLNISPVGGEFSCEFCGFSCNTSKGVVTHKRNCLKNPLSKKNKLISEEPKDEEEEDEEV